MTAFGIQLAWLAMRVTIVAAVALGAVAWCGRRAARSAVGVLAGTMVILLAISLAPLWPLPDGWCWTISRSLDALHASRSATDSMLPAASLAEPFSEQGSSFADLLGWLENSGADARSAPTTHHWGWHGVVFIYVLCIAIGVARLIWGWWELVALRRSSRPITDPELMERADQLRRKLCGAQRVELREVDDFGPAATLGWWRPVILLAADWRSWSDDERCAVLAHELAHVRHRDFLLGLLSSLCRTLHGYHPLVSLLAARMRWCQEIAADDLAATVQGGRLSYLRALARLALRLPARTPAGGQLTLPAMTGGILLRRIEMLRRTEQRPMQGTTRGLLMALLAGVALLVSTWRGPAQTPDSEASAGQMEPFELGYLAPEARGVVALRPSVWMAQAGMDKVSKKLTALFEQAKTMGINLPDVIRPENIEQIVANVHLGATGTGKPGSRSVAFGTTSVLIRFHKDVDGPALLRPLLPDMKEIRKGDVVICRLGAIPELGPVPISMFQPDRRTIVFLADNKNGAEPMLEGATTPRQRDWGNGWKQVERAALAIVLDNRDESYTKTLAQGLPESPELKILENVRVATLGIELGDGRPGRMVLDATSADAAKRLEAAITRLLREGLDKAKEDVKTPHPAEKVWLRLATECLDRRQVQIEGSRLHWVVHSSVRVVDLIGDDGLPLGVSEEREE